MKNDTEKSERRIFKGYLLVYKTDEYITVTPAVSAPDGTVLTDWEELPEVEARELEREFNEKKDTGM